MLFNSYHFLLFFPVVVSLYFTVPHRVKNVWLLVASYFFYMCWNAKYGLILFGCTAVSYCGAIAVERLANAGKSARVRILVFSITLFVLFATVFFYKYLNFTLLMLRRACALVHVSLPKKRFDIVLPVGISFFTFQAAGYIVDVWRGEAKAERNFVQYALFVSFFPQLVAGPIERTRNLMSQLDEVHRFDFERAKDGIFQMIWGFFLKLVIADRAAIFVDAVYAGWEHVNGMILMLATILFAFQIYCDFCGYSTIARGTAQVLGIRLTENFDAPYCAVSVRDFWRRWHISLSTWFRDYVYIPLGGSRCSKWKSYFNVVAVMAVSGLWHGAGFHFIAWGALHGILQVVERLSGAVREKLPKGICWFMTFFWVCVGWCLFRAPSFRTALSMLKRMAKAVFAGDFFRGEHLYAYGLDVHEWHVLVIALAVLVLADYARYKGVVLRERICRTDAFSQIMAVVVSVVFVIAVGVWGGSYNASNFIYFQF